MFDTMYTLFMFKSCATCEVPYFKLYVIVQSWLRQWLCKLYSMKVQLIQLIAYYYLGLQLYNIDCTCNTMFAEEIILYSTNCSCCYLILGGEELETCSSSSRVSDGWEMSLFWNLGEAPSTYKGSPLTWVYPVGDPLKFKSVELGE